MPNQKPEPRWLPDLPCREALCSSGTVQGGRRSPGRRRKADRALQGGDLQPARASFTDPRGPAGPGVGSERVSATNKDGGFEPRRS